MQCQKLFFHYWLDLGYLGVCKISNYSILYCFIPFLWFVLLKEEKVNNNNACDKKKINDNTICLLWIRRNKKRTYDNNKEKQLAFIAYLHKNLGGEEQRQGE